MFMPTTSKSSLCLYNTATRQKEYVTPLDGKTIRMYACGPTVYDFAHIGNFRTFVFEDLLRRTLNFFGMPVIMVMNLTDVDDKTIRGAIKNNLSLDAFTRPFKEAFFEDLKTLRVQPADKYPEATAFIPQMINMVQKLIDEEIAYEGADGSIYFAISKFPGYGKLSHLKLDSLKSGACDRLVVDEYNKESAADFVLWKAYDSVRDGKIFWDSPFGRGRPGWHLECSVMAQNLLGETIDIHAGGVDLIFPHHENEIAQSEACCKKCFSKMWVHAEHLLVDHKKMSKSLGNFYTLRDLLKIGYSGRTVRFAFLQNHYRTQMNFTLQVLDAARASLLRIDEFIARLERYKDAKKSGLTLTEYLDEVLKKFTQALADDLNISEALACLFDMIRHINSLYDRNLLSLEDVQATLELLKRMDQVLAIMNFEKEAIPAEIQELSLQREQARKAKNWALADELRKILHSKGYVIEDNVDGAYIKKI